MDVIPDRYKPSLNYRVCDFEGSLAYFLIWMIYKAGIIIWGLVQTVRIWNIQYDLYNGVYNSNPASSANLTDFLLSESKQISFSMYNNLLFIVLTFIGVGFIDIDSRDYSQYWIRSFCLILSVSVSIFTLFIPLLYVASGHSCTLNALCIKIATDLIHFRQSTLRHPLHKATSDHGRSQRDRFKLFQVEALHDGRVGSHRFLALTLELKWIKLLATRLILMLRRQQLLLLQHKKRQIRTLSCWKANWKSSGRNTNQSSKNIRS